MPVFIRRWVRWTLAALVTGAALAGGMAATSAPVYAAAAGTGGMDLLAQGANFEVLQTSRYASGHWAPTHQLFKNQLFYDFTDVVQNNRLRLFIEQPGGTVLTMEEAEQKSDGTWTTPAPMAGLPTIDATTSLPTRNYLAAAVVGTHVHLVYIGSTGQIMHTYERADGTWTYPDQVAPGSAYRHDKFASVSAASVGGLLQIAVVDQAHKTVLHTVRHADGTWAPWGNVLSPAGKPRYWGMPIRVAMAGFGSSLQMVALTNGQVAQYHTIRHADGSWSRWGDINAQVDFNRAGFIGTVLQEVTAVNVSGNLQLVFASDDDQGSLFHTIRYANGTWSKAGLVQRATNLSSWRPSGVAGSAG
ncbi:hypothetical protein AB0M11_04150 [Streptomyces sp. NPDC051987]|uniref:hypothetical protein n=1 Tax=Streptomyces sp. NPDC051987 TaxID=3155808 RepID=UPI00341A584B